MLAGLSMGATGGIGSTYNIMPQKYIDLYTAFNEGNMKKLNLYKMKFAI